MSLAAAGVTRFLYLQECKPSADDACDATRSLGSLAGEVKDPKRTYPLVIAILIPMVAVFCVWPLAVSLSLDDDRFNYVPGYFNVMATQLAGKWLGVLFVIGAFFSFIGLYLAQVRLSCVLGGCVLGVCVLGVCVLGGCALQLVAPDRAHVGMPDCCL